MKRGNGEGSIYRRKDGRWVAAISLDRGRRKHYFGSCREEAARKLAAALKTRQDGIPIGTERQTVSQFLTGWLENVRPSLRPRTHVRYEQLVRLHALPGLGRLPLSRLSPQHLQRLYAAKLESGLSPRTVHQLHAVLHRALRQAASWGTVPRNVAGLVSPPKGQRRQMAYLSAEQVKTLLQAARGDRLEALYVLAVTTGMRQGELLALRWQDVDLDSGALRIQGTLQRVGGHMMIADAKTSSSRRQIVLPRHALETLQTHRTRQLEERLRMGPLWKDNDLVFPNQLGRPLEASNLLRHYFKPLLRRTGLPAIRFHDLRHTAATLMLGQGIHPKVVSEILGHSQIGITLDLYSHVAPTMQTQAAAAMDALLER